MKPVYGGLSKKLYSGLVYLLQDFQLLSNPCMPNLNSFYFFFFFCNLCMYVFHLSHMQLFGEQVLLTPLHVLPNALYII